MYNVATHWQDLVSRLDCYYNNKSNDQVLVSNFLRWLWIINKLIKSWVLLHEREFVFNKHKRSHFYLHFYVLIFHFLLKNMLYLVGEMSTFVTVPGEEHMGSQKEQSLP